MTRFGAWGFSAVCMIAFVSGCTTWPPELPGRISDRSTAPADDDSALQESKLPRRDEPLYSE